MSAIEELKKELGEAKVARAKRVEQTETWAVHFREARERLQAAHEAQADADYEVDKYVAALHALGVDAS